MNTSVTLTLLTPALAGGATPQVKAEIRGASIRGGLRWWFRVLGGSRDDEEKIFGFIEPKAVASNLVLRLKEPVESKTIWTWKQVNDSHYPGYFLWPLRDTKDGPQPRAIVPEGKQFGFHIGYRNLAEGKCLSERVLSAYSLLGALGNRSRRGMGSLWPDQFIWEGVERTIPTTRETFRQKIGEVLMGTSLSVLRFRKNGFATASDAMNHAANWLKSFRCGSPKSGTPSEWGANDHDLAYNEPRESVFRATLGLPLEQRLSNAPKVTTRVTGYDRLASPVLIKVIRLDNALAPIAIFVPDLMLPNGTPVQVGQNAIPASGQLFEAMCDPRSSINQQMGVEKIV